MIRIECFRWGCSIRAMHRARRAGLFKAGVERAIYRVFLQLGVLFLVVVMVVGWGRGGERWLGSWDVEGK